MQAVTDRLKNFLQYVAVNLIDEPGQAQLKVAELGPNSAGFAADVGDKAQLDAALDSAAAHFGPVEALFANAGLTGGFTPFTMFDSDTFEQTIRVNLTGALQQGVVAKDVILFVIGQLGVNGATDRVLEFHGPIVAAMSMDARMTLCNMAIEAGARAGLVAVDEKTIAIRRSHYKAPQPRATSGVLFKYAKQVKTAADGCVTDED